MTLQLNIDRILGNKSSFLSCFLLFFSNISRDGIVSEDAQRCIKRNIKLSNNCVCKSKLIIMMQKIDAGKENDLVSDFEWKKIT